jgi:hypothetical protein
MPAADLVGAIKAAIQKNKEIPAILDAYGEFVDGQIGPLELQFFDEVFSRILDNLRQRFPEIASSRAANTAKNDISSFLVLAGNDVERTRQVLRTELRSVSRSMAESIAERFTRLTSDDKKAVDATLRLMRRSSTDILFRAEAGKHIGSSGRDFEKFFAGVKTEAPQIKELRYENLIVEKALFNKLLLKTKAQDYTIWVSALYAKENVDYLIERLALPSEHLLLSRLDELKAQGALNSVREFIDLALENSGVVPKPVEIPEALSDFVSQEGNYALISPIDLDDAISFFEKEEEEKAAARKEKEERERAEREQRERAEEEKKAELARSRKKSSPTFETQQVKVERKATTGSIYVGKVIDTQQFTSAINRRAPESELVNLKPIGDYFLESSAVKSFGVAIVGASGAGRSTTTKRILDGIGSVGQRVIVLDQKGEHRGVAWKYQWKTLGFALDSQAQAFKMKMPSVKEDGADRIADVIQEWLLQSGVSCSDQQRARIFSLLSQGAFSIENLANEMSKDPELSQLGAKLSKVIAGKGRLQRIFAEDGNLDLGGETSLLIDVSGRGLRDPTTKEERLILSILALHEFNKSGLSGAVIVLEDVLDRIRAEPMRRDVIKAISELKSKGNSFVVTARGQVREYVGSNCIELLHRLSGEKAMNEELSGFSNDLQIRNLNLVVGFLPRGFLITSNFSFSGSTEPSAVVKVEPLQFG